MPRHVDADQRRREIVDATIAVLAKSGSRGLTFRSVANEMGGSTTLITHYFPTQSDLLDEVTNQTLAKWDGDIRAVDAAFEDAAERLVGLLKWLVPVTPAGMEDELVRIHLLAGQLLGDEHRAMFESWDRQIRGYLRSHIEGVVEPDKVDRTVELLRVVTSGIVLSVVEHPDLWSAERQFAVLDDVLGLLGLNATIDTVVA